MNIGYVPVRASKVKSEQLERIIRLREANASWLAIGKAVGIDRRTAKKVYNDWNDRQTQEELLGVRKEVAAEDFRDHRDYIITLASYLIDNLGLPDSPIETNSEQFFLTLWEKDIFNFLRKRWTNYPIIPLGHNMKRINMKRIKSNIQDNEQILNCLLIHTKELRWEVLDEWKTARNNCTEVLGELQKESSKLVNNLMKQPHFKLDGLNEGCEEENPIGGMVEAAVQAIWLWILRDEPEEFPLIKAVPVNVKQIRHLALKVESRTFLIFTDNLAETAAKLCNQTVINLCKGEETHIVQSLLNQISIMKGAAEELAEMLDPLKLQPIILRSRCNLCPA